MLARLPRLTAAETRRAVADAVVRVDPAAARERAERKKAERRIERVPDRDGRTGWFLPMRVAEEGDAWSRATELAKKVRAARRAAGLDDPGLDALRVDVALDMLLGRDPLRDARLIAAPRRPPGPSPARCSCGGKQVAAVVIDAATLLGLADNPGRVPGYGLVPAELAREIAADRDFVRWLVAPRHRRAARRRAPTPTGPASGCAASSAPATSAAASPAATGAAEQCDLDHVHAFSLVTRGRQDDPRQPRAALPAAPQRQDPRRLAPHLRPDHPHQDLDQPPRPHLPHHATPLLT